MFLSRIASREDFSGPDTKEEATRHSRPIKGIVQSSGSALSNIALLLKDSVRD